MKSVVFPATGIIVLWFLCATSQISRAQENGAIGNDSMLILRPGMDTSAISRNATAIHIDSAALNRPKIATFFAAALPGLGQIYNRNYWKLPILYGGASVMGYYISWNNNKYHQLLAALVAKQNGITSNDLANHAKSLDQLKYYVDYYRRNRDYLMILMAGLYLLQIVDAQVQAQLMDFDLTNDLSLQIKPVMNDQSFASRNIGVGIVLTFN